MTTATGLKVNAGPKRVARRISGHGIRGGDLRDVADPDRHPELDGSGTVRDVEVKGPHHLAVGDEFTVGMKQYGVPYKIAASARAPLALGTGAGDAGGQHAKNANGITAMLERLAGRFRS